MDLCWVVVVVVVAAAAAAAAAAAVWKVRHADVPVVAAEAGVEAEGDGNSFPTEAAMAEVAAVGAHRVAVRTIWPEELAALWE